MSHKELLQLFRKNVKNDKMMKYIVYVEKNFFKKLNRDRHIKIVDSHLESCCEKYLEQRCI